MRQRFGLMLAFSILCTGTASLKAAEANIPNEHLRIFQHLPAFITSSDSAMIAEKIQLGRMLYYEPRLSANQKISCNSCHNLNLYGADKGPVSIGFRGQIGARNSPTVYNAAGHLAQFWDGRASDVEAQAKGPLMNPVEMAMTSQERVIETLNSIPEYVSLFRKAFPGDHDPVTFDNLANAIGMFERGLVTPARWDKFLEGDHSALSDTEKQGFNVFYDSGCASCHSGTYLGGSQYQRLGLAKAWPDTHDVGRFAITRDVKDKSVFKVPSLRNIEKTGPYFHDGSMATLRDSIRAMEEYQVGKNLTDSQIDAIEAFLKSLTGEIPADYIKMPDLPKSTNSTPKPVTE